ncbi:MAG: hypothetical protein AB8H03_14335 [Saprospiraceae bacterium]
MRILLYFNLIYMIVFFVGCNQSAEKKIDKDNFRMQGKGILLTTRFNSFEELKKEIEIEYSKDGNSWVRLRQVSNGQKIESELKEGVSETDILNARDGNFWDKVALGFKSPFFVINRKNLLGIYVLSRRKQIEFGEGDIAFYDVANTMFQNINEEDIVLTNQEDQSEKGFINTFNHVNAQAIMTTIFSEKLADFVADTHERRNMPELISGKFTEAQINDIKNGPVDNYVDIINNEWGQELGKLLKRKYKINQNTIWTPELLTNYLNDLQSFYSWSLQIGFKPFKTSDQLIKRFSHKINSILKSVTDFE